jgi:uncharacterized protein YggE
MAIGKILPLAALIASSLVAHARAEDDDEPPTVSVTGRGRIFAQPDVATINVGVATQAPTARDALAANTQAMTKLQGLLKEQGIAAKDIQTNQIQIYPQYSQPAPGRRPGAEAGEFVPRIVAYRVDNMVQITARRIEKLGALLDALVQAGANQIHGITFRVDDPEKLLDEARKRAVADAKRKAEALVGEAGVVLGPPRIIEELDGAAPPPPRPMNMRMAEMAASAPVPIAAGEQELSVVVRVVYELRVPRAD